MRVLIPRQDVVLSREVDHVLQLDAARLHKSHHLDAPQWVALEGDRHQPYQFVQQPDGRLHAQRHALGLALDEVTQARQEPLVVVDEL